jgi:hypothetical protein
MRKHRHQLDPSVGGSGPHDFAVRAGTLRRLMPTRPPHPALHVRDDREAPLLRARDGDCSIAVSTKSKSEIFFVGGLDRIISEQSDLPVGQINLSDGLTHVYKHINRNETDGPRTGIARFAAETVTLSANKR